jgi:endonuclease III
MYDGQERAAELLLARGNELLGRPYTRVDFSGHREADDLLNDLERFPHAFVLACVMDRQMKAERVWQIPYEVSLSLSSFDMSRLVQVDLQELKMVFQSKSLHRFPELMAENFHSTVHKITDEYDGDASNIWKGNPRSATIVRRFLQFKGVGVKIASMAANILARDFKVPMKDHICIDISPDVHVRRVFKRLGFTSNDTDTDDLIFAAREFNPEYPGVFDLSCWDIGRTWCRPQDPDCEACYLTAWCPKLV